MISLTFSLKLLSIFFKTSRKLKQVRKTTVHGLTHGVSHVGHGVAKMRLSGMKRSIRKMGVRIRTSDRLSGLGFNPHHFKIFQKEFMRLLRIGNMMQAFYIALIISHWCWYAPKHWEAVMEIVPLTIIYLFITPLTVRRYAMIMSLGKPNPRAMSLTIEYMEHNEQALHQVAELIVDSKSEKESIDDVFQDWDTNGDQELSFKELNEAMHACNMHMQKERLKAMWNKIDIDSSGSISNEEFTRAIGPYVNLVIKEREDHTGQYAHMSDSFSSINRPSSSNSLRQSSNNSIGSRNNSGSLNGETSSFDGIGTYT
mmetsp:Transcript_29957/g.38644  ORF Transcript_29957/g.38644 Transcript_29957/m.38644 type:complete len:313 (-) Transcript_29957:94-1032(-)